MGQAGSTHDGLATTHEGVTKALANRFAEKCFSSIELYSLKDNFKKLADVEHDVHYLKEDTVARFLELPDILDVSPVIFQMISYIGAFPFLQDAPAVLGLEQMVMVISVMTERYQRILAKGATNRRQLLFRSLAVFDRKLSAIKEKPPQVSQDQPSNTKSHIAGFAVDVAGDDEDDEGVDDEDDGLVLTALETMNLADAFRADSHATTHGAIIPADNFRKLLMLLLLIAPLLPEERLSQYAECTTGEELKSLRSVAESVLATFLDVETSPGIQFGAFSRIVPICMPHLFDGFNALFEQFLFTKAIDFSKSKEKSGTEDQIKSAPLAPPLLSEQGSILTTHAVSQLSLFIPGSSLFHRLRPLYSGEIDGFSMGSFESKVFNWRAPTILLVRGTRLSPEDTASGSGERFVSSLPTKRFGDGSKADRLTFGVYISQPWRHTNRECFGDTSTILFQLAPIHDVLPASSLKTDYVAFAKSGPAAGSGSGITVGSPPPQSGAAFRHDDIVHLGPISLYLDSSFEYGVFTHDYNGRGGAFSNSVSRRYDFQDRFEIESLEVWGCGGDEEAKIQAERWAFEAREAEARRKINLGTGDIEADRALLEMAGLVGANRSGGSMA